MDLTCPTMVAITTVDPVRCYCGNRAGTGLTDWWFIEQVCYPMRLSGNSWMSYRVVEGSGEPLELSDLRIESAWEIPPGCEDDFRQRHWIPALEERVTDPSTGRRFEDPERVLEQARTGRLEYDGHPGHAAYGAFARLAQDLRLPYPQRDFLRSQLFTFVVPGWYGRE